MFFKNLPYLALIISLALTIYYFAHYDMLTRNPLRILSADTPYATELRNILDEFTDATNITVFVETIPAIDLKETVQRDSEAQEAPYDLVMDRNMQLPSYQPAGNIDKTSPLYTVQFTLMENAHNTAAAKAFLKWWEKQVSNQK